MKFSFKKTTSSLLTMLLLTSTFAVTTVNAAQEGTITVSEAEASIGETVDVDVTVNDNPGIMGMTLDISFNQNVLELVEVKDAGILGTQSHKKEKVSPYRLAWSDDTATIDNTTNGVAVTLSFKVSEHAVPGDTYVIDATYDYDNYDIYDTNMNPVKFNIVSGSIKIPAPEHAHNLSLIGGTKESCTNEGKKSYYVCDGCDKWFEDESASIEITDKDSVIIPREPHSPSAWIVDERATKSKTGLRHKDCTICHNLIETEVISVLPVTFGDTNLDEVVNIDDVTFLQMHLARYTDGNGNSFIDELNENIFAISDIDQDCVLSASDVTDLQMILAGYELKK